MTNSAKGSVVLVRKPYSLELWELDSESLTYQLTLQINSQTAI